MPRRRSSRSLVGAAALLALAALLTACGDDAGVEDAGTSGNASTTSTTSATSTSTTHPNSSSTAMTTPTSPPTTRAGAGDWEGFHWDYGVIDRIDRTEDGRTLIVFDRGELPGATSNQSVDDFTEEPIVYGNTDLGMVNENPKLRTYVADDAVEVLRITNLRDTCADRDNPAKATWGKVTIDDVVDDSLWDQYRQVSLTFDVTGRVLRIRLSSGC
jgi:hypothetical protein